MKGREGLSLRQRLLLDKAGKRITKPMFGSFLVKRSFHAFPALTICLLGSAAEDDGVDGGEEDVVVHPEGPVVDVEDVESYAFFVVGIASA